MAQWQRAPLPPSSPLSAAERRGDVRKEKTNYWGELGRRERRDRIEQGLLVLVDPTVWMQIRRRRKKEKKIGQERQVCNLSWSTNRSRSNEKT